MSIVKDSGLQNTSDKPVTLAGAKSCTCGCKGPDESECGCSSCCGWGCICLRCAAGVKPCAQPFELFCWGD